MSLLFIQTHFAYAVLIFLSLGISRVNCDTYDNADAIYKSITSNYSKDIRPTLKQSDPVNVSIIPILRSINQYDEVSGALSMILVLSVMWIDQKLTWDPSKYGGVDSLVVPQKNLWKPELFLINPSDNLVPIGNDDFKIRIVSDGTMTWFTGGDMNTSCSPDMTYFPFDTQTCHLIFAPWGYYANETALHAIAHVDVSNATNNGAWNLKEASYKVYLMMEVSMLEITFKLERKPLFYLLTLIFPIISLCALNPMVFTLPNSSGERVSFCVTVLLSLAVFMTVTSDIIPKVSEPFPIICIYLFVIQTLSGIITSVNGLILVAYDHDDADSVPKFVWRFTLLAMDIIGCSCHKKRNPSKSSVQPQHSENIGSKMDLKLEDYTDSEPKVNPNVDNPNSWPKDIKTLDYLQDGHQSYIKHKPGWKTVAKTLDRTCFIISYLVLISTSIVFLVILIFGNEN